MLGGCALSLPRVLPSAAARRARLAPPPARQLAVAQPQRKRLRVVTATPAGRPDAAEFRGPNASLSLLRRCDALQDPGAWARRRHEALLVGFF
jgi:hypothetical protein